MEPAQPFISEGSIPNLAILFLSGGLAALAAFSVAEVSDRKKNQELLLGIVASLMIAFGSTFLLIWCGAFI